jgi:thiamine monophosphate synthase
MRRESPMDFIFMLTRRDRTIEDAADLVDVACDLGVRHVGFKDVGASPDAMYRLAARIRRRGALCYLEVVDTSPEGALQSLRLARDLGVDRILGGTDVAAAQRILGEASRYFPFSGRPIGHPTRLAGSAALVAEHCRYARAMGCGGVDLLAYRAMDADPLDLVCAARAALDGGRLIVAGGIHTKEQIDSLSRAGVDAFTVGSAVFDGAFSPAKTTLRDQLLDILAACDAAAGRPA